MVKISLLMLSFLVLSAQAGSQVQKSNCELNVSPRISDQQISVLTDEWNKDRICEATQVAISEKFEGESKTKMQITVMEAYLFGNLLELNIVLKDGSVRKLAASHVWNPEENRVDILGDK